MRLTDAASFFDRTPVNDGYTGDFLFMAQMGLYDDTKRDSEVAERRVISTAANVELPARRVVEMLGARYILGKANPDVYDGEVIRLGHVAHEASTLANVKTLAEASLGEEGMSAWCAHAWVKNKAFTEQSSNLAGEFHLFFAATEVIKKNLLVEYQQVHFIVRAKNVSAAGFNVVTAEEIDTPTFQEGYISSGYDPVSGTFSTGESSVKVIRLRWQGLFQHGSSMSTPFGPDEQQFVIAKYTRTVLPGNRITLDDGVFNVKSVESLDDVWVCRVARHA